MIDQEKDKISEIEEKTEGQTKKIDNDYLFNRQKELLDTFLSKNAITKAQYDKSLGCLIEKMKHSKDNN